jgi:hypothetical protein
VIVAARLGPFFLSKLNRICEKKILVCRKPQQKRYLPPKRQFSDGQICNFEEFLYAHQMGLYHWQCRDGGAQ